MVTYLLVRFLLELNGSEESTASLFNGANNSSDRRATWQSSVTRMCNICTKYQRSAQPLLDVSIGRNSRVIDATKFEVGLHHNIADVLVETIRIPLILRVVAFLDHHECLHTEDPIGEILEGRVDVLVLALQHKYDRPIWLSIQQLFEDPTGEGFHTHHFSSRRAERPIFLPFQLLAHSVAFQSSL